MWQGQQRLPPVADTELAAAATAETASPAATNSRRCLSRPQTQTHAHHCSSTPPRLQLMRAAGAIPAAARFADRPARRTLILSCRNFSKLAISMILSSTCSRQAGQTRQAHKPASACDRGCCCCCRRLVWHGCRRLRRSDAAALLLALQWDSDAPGTMILAPPQQQQGLTGFEQSTVNTLALAFLAVPAAALVTAMVAVRLQTTTLSTKRARTVTRERTCMPLQRRSHKAAAQTLNLSDARVRTERGV